MAKTQPPAPAPAPTPAAAPHAPAPAPAPRAAVAPSVGTRTTKVVEVESEATAAAGPHRPEPAKQRFHNPGNEPVDPEAARRPISTYRLKVRATQDGYIYEARRRVGDVFTITDKKHFSKRWMEPVDGSTPEKATGPNAAIAKQHDETLAAKHAERTGQRIEPATGDSHVLDDDL
jgi:hypothetical protein